MVDHRHIIAAVRATDPTPERREEKAELTTKPVIKHKFPPAPAARGESEADDEPAIKKGERS
jgi:hypothetical protein